MVTGVLSRLDQGMSWRNVDNDIDNGWIDQCIQLLICGCFLFCLRRKERVMMMIGLLA